MLKKVAVALLAASMIAAPVFAAGTTSPAPAKTAQPAKASVKPAKIVGVKKVKRVKQGKRHYAKDNETRQAAPNQADRCREARYGPGADEARAEAGYQRAALRTNGKQNNKKMSSELERPAQPASFNSSARRAGVAPADNRHRAGQWLLRRTAFNVLQTGESRIATRVCSYQFETRTPPKIPKPGRRNPVGF